jgi:glucose-6-phosphate dehydrogenase assembly protein OpcA
MPSTYRVLGQLAPSAVTASTLYTVPASRAAIVSTINVSNFGSSPDTIRIAIRPAGATLANQHYIVFGVVVPAGSVFTFTAGITLATTDVLTVYSTTGSSAFNAFGSEVTL